MTMLIITIYDNDVGDDNDEIMMMIKYSQICLKQSHWGPTISGHIYRWPFRTDCINRECAAEGQKQSGRITQMTV
jgi:hypothetical protein